MPDLSVNTIRERGRDVPVCGVFDVLVCGGGTSGVPAAIAAGRAGMKTCVIERNGFLGGVPAANINPTWHGSNRVEARLLAEFLERAHAVGNIPPREDAVHIDAETMKYVSLELILEAGVEIHFDTMIVETLREDGVVYGVITESISGRRAFLAKRVIDATGGGEVAFKAGAEYMVGDGEAKIQGMSLRVRFGNIEFDRYFDWIEQHPELFDMVTKSHVDEFRRRNAEGKDFHIKGNLVPLFRQHPEIPNLPYQSYFNCSKLLPRELNCNATRVDGLDPNVEQNVTRGEIECRRQAIALYTLMKRHVPGWENAVIVETAPRIGIRESRCIIGDYTLTADDCVNGVDFEDSICRNDWIHFDLHDPDSYSCDRTSGPVTIPYRSLLPRGIENLLIVGRAASADHVANSGVRQMRTVFIIGQVAGLAAARSMKLGCTVRELPYAELKQAMECEGVRY